MPVPEFGIHNLAHFESSGSRQRLTCSEVRGPRSETNTTHS